MSEWMTDEVFRRHLDEQTLRGWDPAEQAAYCAAAAKREAHRARASEVEKDAQIKALADALWRVGESSQEYGWHTDDCMRDAGAEKCTKTCEVAAAALRLCGRL